MQTRLIQLIRDLDISKNQFATEIGTSSAMISKITKSKVNFGIDIIEKIISRYPRLNQQWLLTGIGEMWSESHTYNLHPNPHLTENEKNLNEEALNGGNNGGDLGGNKAKNDLTTNNNYNFGDILDHLAQSSYLNNFRGNNKTDFYYRHSQSKVNIILKNTTELLQEVYESYYKLVNVSINLGCPEWMIEKFPPSGQTFKAFLKEINDDLKEEYEEVSDKKLFQCLKITEYENHTVSYHNSLSKLINFMDMYTDRYNPSRVIGQ